MSTTCRIITRLIFKVLCKDATGMWSLVLQPVFAFDTGMEGR
jgi:hypothetical protein